MHKSDIYKYIAFSSLVILLSLSLQVAYCYSKDKSEPVTVTGEMDISKIGTKIVIVMIARKDIHIVRVPSIIFKPQGKLKELVGSSTIRFNGMTPEEQTKYRLDLLEKSEKTTEYYKEKIVKKSIPLLKSGKKLKKEKYKGEIVYTFCREDNSCEKARKMISF